MHAALDVRLTRRWLDANDPPLLASAVRHFGRLSAARAAAGVADPPRRRWDPARIAREVRSLYQQGHRITMPVLKRLGREDLLTAISNYAGGIVHARRLAGIPEPSPLPRRRGAPWDETRVVHEILDRAARSEPLAYSKVPRSLAAAGHRFFTTWRAAVEAAGLDYDEIRLIRPPYTKSEVITLLRELARRRPGMGWVDVNEHPASKAMIRHFGSVAGAVRAAEITGWPRSKVRRWNRQRVIDALRLHGGAPVSKALAIAARVHVGSVREARAAAHAPLRRNPSGPSNGSTGTPMKSGIDSRDAPAAANGTKTSHLIGSEISKVAVVAWLRNHAAHRRDVTLSWLWQSDQRVYRGVLRHFETIEAALLCSFAR